MLFRVGGGERREVARDGERGADGGGVRADVVVGPLDAEGAAVAVGAVALRVLDLDAEVAARVLLGGPARPARSWVPGSYNNTLV